MFNSVILMFIVGCISESLPTVIMSKWQQQEERQASGTGENTPSVSRCHQVSQKPIWSSQGCQDITNLTLIQHSAQVALLAEVTMILTMKVKGSKWKESFPGVTDPRPRITNHPFRRLNHRLESYNPARPWNVAEPRRRCCTPPRRARSNTPTPARPNRRSRLVSFARNIRSPIPNTSRNAGPSRSPVRPVNVNIVMPAYTTPLVRHVRTPTPPRPAAPPPYSPPSPIYRPDPTPSPPGNIVNTAQCSGGSVSISPQCPRTGASVYKTQSALTPPRYPNVSKPARTELKLWEKIQIELPKDLSRFCKEVTENIGNYSDLVDFAVKCDAPITWIDRAKEDNPNDSQSAIKQVFYEWWDRSHLNLARKLKMIQAAFGYMGKPAIFNRIVYGCPDVKMLLDHAVLTRLPNLIGGKHGKTGTNPCTLENVWTLAQEKLRAGKLLLQYSMI